VKKLEAHGKKYSKSYAGKYSSSSLWATNKHAMFSKTVLKSLISKWGIMSTTMQKAITADQAVIRSYEQDITPENMDYADNTVEGEHESGSPEKTVVFETNKEPDTKGTFEEAKNDYSVPGENPWEDAKSEQMEIF
jgi:recombination protein RecT